MAAFAVAQALRGGRGPTAAALALGHRTLLRADTSRTPLHALQAQARRSLASGNGTGGSGAGMGAGRSGAGCMGGCAKEILDLRAEMLEQHQQLSLWITSLNNGTITLRESIAKHQIQEDTRLVKTVYWVMAASVAGSIGTVGFAFTMDFWKKEVPACKDGSGAVA